MKHVICPYCSTRIPAERFRSGEVVIPEFLVCDVCGQTFEQTEHRDSEYESAIHKALEKINQIPDGEPDECT